jgi:hypothetical protein
MLSREEWLPPPYVELELRTWNRELPRAAHFLGNKTSFSFAITAG